jgi:hypothetical protein
LFIGNYIPKMTAKSKERENDDVKEEIKTDAEDKL